jgi:hypothetical protein
MPIRISDSVRRPVSALARLVVAGWLIGGPTAYAGASDQEPSPPVAELAATAAASCRTDPRVVGKCFWTRGTLSLGSGNPAARLAVKGSNRVIGIKEDEDPTLPGDVKSVLDFENRVTGDFHVCPFSRYKPKQMQIGCVDEAKNWEATRGPRSGR